YEAEICFRTTSDTKEWKPVRSLYLPQWEDGPDEDGATVSTVTAAVALEDMAMQPGEAWRLRVRASGGNWSSPTPWQEQDVSHEVLLLIDKPEVRGNAFSYTLEFEVATDGDVPAELPQNVHFEVQVQGRKRRGSSKFSDWVGLRSFCTMPEQVEDTSKVLVRSLVERAVAADAIKASFGYEELRFRVRGVNSQGFSAPSEPSETQMLQMALPAAGELPPFPAFLGRGYCLMEDRKHKSLTHAEIIHLHWPKPQVEVRELNDGLPPLEYKLEMQHHIGEEETDWEPVPAAMLFSEPASNNVSALVPLDQEADEVDDCDFEYAEQESRLFFQTKPTPTEARFRLCADRPSSDISKFDPVHSRPSEIFAWKLPDVPNALRVVGQSGNMICVIFNWPRLSQLSGHLWVCMEAHQSFETDKALSLWYVSLDASKDQLSASELVAKACAAATKDTCIGLTPLPDRCASAACVRIRLQLFVRQSIHQTSWSKSFVLESPKVKASAGEQAPQKICTLHLQYPSWTCVLPGLDENQTAGKFFPRVVLREREEGADPREILLLGEASNALANLQLNFQLVEGDLPACLQLDSSSGAILWRHALVDNDDELEKTMASVMDTFSIQVSFPEDWSESQLGLEVPAHLSASTTLHLAAAPSLFRGDDAAWEFIGGILKGPALEVLSERGVEALQAASELLQ
ncbi:unnamed protein product, partial [Symbiodinium pilosum]